MNEQRPSNLVVDDLRQACRSGKGNYGHRLLCGRAAEEIERLQQVWRCFHCDEVFTDRAAALEHFGPHQYADAACTIDVAEYRRMEQCCRSHHEEDTELHRALCAKDSEMAQAVRRSEEEGYARGLSDAKKHPETLGLRVAVEPSACRCGEARAVLRRMKDEYLKDGKLSGRMQREADDLLQRLVSPAPKAPNPEHNHLHTCDTQSECVACELDYWIGEAQKARPSEPPSERYGVQEVLAYLKERAEWIDREIRNGGNLEHLRTRYEECRYIAKCIEDTHRRLSPTKSEGAA